MSLMDEGGDHDVFQIRQSVFDGVPHLLQVDSAQIVMGKPIAETSQLAPGHVRVPCLKLRRQLLRASRYGLQVAKRGVLHQRRVEESFPS